MGGLLKKYRPSHLIVVPPDLFKEGDVVPPGFRAAAKMAAPSRKSLAAPPAGDKKPATLSVDHLFCWFCARCDANNAMLERECRSCGAAKTRTSRRSLLLEVAEKATEKDGATTVECAMDNIPASSKTSIPEWVIASLLTNRTQGGSLVGGGCLPTPASAGFETFFTWICGYCTMQNNYRRTTCLTCLQGKENLAEPSPLLRVSTFRCYSVYL